MLDATVGGALLNKTPEVAYGLLDELASNNYQWVSERSNPRIVVRVIEFDMTS